MAGENVSPKDMLNTTPSGKRTSQRFIADTPPLFLSPVVGPCQRQGGIDVEGRSGGPGGIPAVPTAGPYRLRMTIARSSLSISCAASLPVSSPNSVRWNALAIFLEISL